MDFDVSIEVITLIHEWAFFVCANASVSVQNYINIPCRPDPVQGQAGTHHTILRAFSHK